MAGMYICRVPDAEGGIARAVDFDMFEITPGDDNPVALHAVIIGQLTETGDTAEEFLEVSIQRGGTAMTSGSAGTGSLAAQAPQKTHSSLGTAGFTYDAGNETEATFTAGVVLHRDSFNVRTGYQWIWTPETRPVCTQANGGIVVRIENTPADSITFVGTLYVEELG
jgi:hypothetical protein